MRANPVLFALSLLAGGIAFSIAGCPGGTPAGQGKVRLLITDKPYPYDFIEEALVTITRVEVRQAAAADAEATESGDGNDATPDQSDQSDAADGNVVAGETSENGADEGDGPFIVIFQGEKTFNLLDLQNGKTDLLADAEIPAGHYTQMRLVVTQGQVTLTDGREFPLTAPSGSSSGIKLHFEFEVSAEEETVLLLDVDMSRAFKAIPSGHIEDVSTIREFKFAPSIAMRLINLLEAGTISGTVTDAAFAPLANVSITAFKDEVEVTSTSSLADGTYQLGGLPTGTYHVEFSLAGYVDIVVENVEVQAGAATAGVNAVVNSASPTN